MNNLTVDINEIIITKLDNLSIYKYSLSCKDFNKNRIEAGIPIKVKPEEIVKDIDTFKWAVKSGYSKTTQVSQCIAARGDIHMLSLAFNMGLPFGWGTGKAAAHSSNDNILFWLFKEVFTTNPYEYSHKIFMPLYNKGFLLQSYWSSNNRSKCKNQSREFPTTLSNV